MKATHRQRRPGFTLVELVVVIAIIGILAGAILVAGRTVVDSAKSRNTQMMLSVVQNAIDQFSQDQQERSTVTRKRAYRDRYGTYPPDELEVFTETGIPNGPSGSLAPGGTRVSGEIVRPEVVPGPASSVTYTPMTFQLSGYPDDETRGIAHRDMAAMLLAIDLFSESADLLIGKLSADHLVTPQRMDGTPLLFLDRNANQTFDPLEDQALRYLVDDWGTPISYMAQRDYDPENPPTTASSNGPEWNEMSTRLVRINGNQPILFSYGPNGPDQLAPETIMAGQADSGAPPANLPDDFADNGRIDSPLNEDNIYTDESLGEKLRRGAR